MEIVFEWDQRDEKDQSHGMRIAEKGSGAQGTDAPYLRFVGFACFC